MQVPTAVVEFANLSVRVRRDAGNGFVNYAHDLSATLRETSGLSGARLDSVRVESPEHLWNQGIIAWDETTQNCWRKTLRVEAGGTLDLFTLEALADCAPGIGWRTPLPYLTLRVGFVDDANRRGVLSARIDIPE